MILKPVLTMTVFSATSIFIAICLVGVALAANPGDKDFSCTPGSSFKVDCNTCTCSPDGKNAACTLRGCLKKREARGQPGQPGYCTPGEHFKEDCNSCTCTEDGTRAYCTEMACNVHHQRKRDSPAANPGEAGYCTPGQSFKHDCNTCTCTPDGKNAYCTLMGRPSLQNRPVRNAPAPRPNTPGFTCNPGAQFKDDCNSCTCSPDGTSAVCTLKLCRQRRESPAPNTPGFTCTAGESFKYQCNSCRCGANGKSAACTFAACPPGSYRRRRQTPVCQDNETKQEDCNTCRCARGEWACTRRLCPKSKRAAPRPNTPGFTCNPGEHFKDDCNSCTCSPDGTSAACTFKLCRQRRETQCQDNETKQDDCNTCKCARGEWACTRRLCPKSKREDPVEKEFNGTSCAPNDKFKIDCNTCYCNSDGSGYSCTEKLCASASSTQP